MFYLFQVRAVKFGHVLVVDEADKAPTHVTCILKSLVESGVMVLGDGRRIVTGNKDNWIRGRGLDFTQSFLRVF